jgi:hypothetical protein
LGESLVWVEWSLVEIYIRRNSLVHIHVRIYRDVDIRRALRELVSHLIKVRVVVVVWIKRLIHGDLLKLIHRDLLVGVVLWGNAHWIYLIGKRLSIRLVG